MRSRAGAAAAGAAAMMVLVAAGCGGDDGGGATSKAEWQKQHGALVQAYSRTLDDAINNINQGNENTQGSCTQAGEDARDIKSEALPVPNATVNAALTRSADAAIKASADCIRGARQTDARAVEAAQASFKEARTAMDEAEAAIEAWS